MILFLLCTTAVNAQIGVPCIDGNSTEWDGLAVTGNATYELRHDTFEGNMDSIFTSSKDFKSWGNWTPTPDYSTWTTSPMQAKSDIMNAAAVIFTGVTGSPGCTATFGNYDPNHTYLFFAGDRESNNGTGYIGFWFNLNGSTAIDDGNKYFFPDHATNFGEQIPGEPEGTFYGLDDSIGDILVLADFDGGGRDATVQVLKWVGPGNGNLGNNNSLYEIGIASQVGQNNDTFVPVPSNFIVPAGQMTEDITDGINGPEDNIDNPVQVYDYNEFYEGVVDLTPIFSLANNPKLLCTATWMLETRSSSEITADSKDFVGGNFNIAPTIDAGDDVVCVGESGTLTATLYDANDQAISNDGYTFAWYAAADWNGGDPNPADDMSVGGSNSLPVTIAGDYYVVATSDTHCDAIGSGMGTLSNYDNPTPSVGNQSECDGDGTVTFSTASVTGETYQWYLDNVIITGATGNSYTTGTVSSSMNGNVYKVVATSSDGCDGDESGTLIVYPNPTCIASNNGPQCYGVPILLSVVGSDGTAPYTYEWTGASAGLLDDVYSATPIFTGGAIGDHVFNVTVTDANGCTNTCTTTAVVWDCTPDCETAYGVFIGDDGAVDYDASTCFRTNGFHRWGWTNEIVGPNEPGDPYVLELYKGAGKCDLNKGEYVGTVTIDYAADGTVNITYEMAGAHGMSEAHLYIGCDPYPTGNSGNITVAPGQYTFNSGDLDFVSTTWSTPTDGIDAEGSFYVIAHAVVCGEDIPEGSYIPVSPFEGGEFDNVDPAEMDTDCKIDICEFCRNVDFTAYPVPFEDEVNIKYSFDYETDVTIEVFDIKGTLIKTDINNNYVKGTQDKTTLDLSSASNQLFFVRLTTSNGTVTKKIVSSSLKR